MLAGAVVAALLVLDARPDRADVGAPAGGGVASGAAGPLASSAVPSPPTRPPQHGAYVLSAVSSGGRVDVQTWIATARPVSALDLSTPGPGRQRGSARAEDVVVRDLEGVTLARVARVGTTVVRVGLSAASTGLYLRYTVRGGLDRAASTVSGRELVRVLSIVVGFDGVDGGVRHLVTATGGRVLNVACLATDAGDGAAPRPCGRPTGQDDWTVDLTGGHRADLVLAQVEWAR